MTTGPRVAMTHGASTVIQPYLDALRAVGLEPVCNPASLDGLAGLFLCGGTDVNPALYGAEAHPETQPPDIERDDLELRLLREALDKDLPTLCVCRGLQLFNVAHGGTLVQHLEETPRHRVKGEDEAHSVEAVTGTTVGRLLGAGPKPVNSRHHQAVDRLGRELMVSARAADGTVEALERPDRTFAVAVQWHPEDRLQYQQHDLRLFREFAGKCIGRAGSGSAGAGCD